MALKCISFLALLSASQLITTAQESYNPRTSFTKEELIADSFSWLASEDNHDELNIFKLSCPSCIQELKAAFVNDPTNIGLINLSTYRKGDRPLAQVLLATTLSYDDESKQAEIFGQLLELFVNSTDQFLKNPTEWQTLCLGFWNLDSYNIDDRRIWADALNWLDKQNRINMLLDMTQFPGSLELKPENKIPPITRDTYRDGYSFVALSIPWLKYPETHPIPGKILSQNHPEQLPVTLIDPLKQSSKTEWADWAKVAETGTFWHFVGDSEIVLHPRLLNFLAGFLDMPTDQERRDAFSKAIAQISEERSRSKSLLAVLPRVKGLPKADPERESKRVEEARNMIEDFLAYDLMRK